jgi:hypothetical protein
MLKIISVIALSLGASVAGYSQSRVPQFRDYPPNGEAIGKNAPVVITREDRMYRTRLPEAAREKPNFAGHLDCLGLRRGMSHGRGNRCEHRKGLLVPTYNLLLERNTARRQVLTY